jgi:hypothetical protein
VAQIIAALADVTFERIVVLALERIDLDPVGMQESFGAYMDALLQQVELRVEMEVGMVLGVLPVAGYVEVDLLELYRVARAPSGEGGDS